MIRVGVDVGDRARPARRWTTMPELLATAVSSPVATIGGSVTSSGTAWRCMFEPISARLASSCSRNGIRPAETPTICLGEMSMYCDLVDGDDVEVAADSGR